MQNPIQKLRQSSIVFEKPGILSEKLITLTSSNYLNFLFKFCSLSLHINVYKRVFGIALILFKTWVICQNKKRPGFYTLTETRFFNNWRSKQNKIFFLLLRMAQNVFAHASFLRFHSNSIFFEQSAKLT